ncbi:hypothetical protein G6F62_015791 [Rhizopus arrhizus]|nr:hypothetical protein G6F62_015791 [Rhizopus arrhizus]
MMPSKGFQRGQALFNAIGPVIRAQRISCGLQLLLHERQGHLSGRGVGQLFQRSKLGLVEGLQERAG